MAPDQRRDAIIAAAIPLFMERGADVTTKDIADCAGIAEGTLFRVFPDKQSLIEAVVGRYMDPTPTLERLAAIDATLPLRDKLIQVVEILIGRFAGVMGIMNALGIQHHHGKAHHKEHARDVHRRMAGSHITQGVFEPDAPALRIPPSEVVDYVRLLAFASAMPVFSDQRTFSAEELADFILRGIVKEAN